MTVRPSVFFDRSIGEATLTIFTLILIDAKRRRWVPKMDRLFVAVPHRDSQQAEIRFFDAQ
jgi:hypothetical protein